MANRFKYTLSAPSAVFGAMGVFLIMGIIVMRSAGCRFGSQQDTQISDRSISNGVAYDTLHTNNAFWLSVSHGNENRIIGALLADRQKRWVKDSIILPNKYDEGNYNIEYLFKNEAQDSVALIKSGYDGQYFLAYAYLKSNSLTLSQDLVVGDSVRFLNFDSILYNKAQVVVICTDEEGYTQIEVKVKNQLIESVRLTNIID